MSDPKSETERTKMSLRKHHLIIGAFVVVSILIGVAMAAWMQYGNSVPPPEQVRGWLNDTLQTIPVPVYFLAFVVLPAFGMPQTFFYLTAIPVLGEGESMLGIPLAILAVALNIVFTRLLARGVLQPVVERIIRRRGLKIPELQPGNEMKITLALRLSPVPFAIQNYLLAMGRASWLCYLWVSLLIQGIIGTAVMLVGESVLTGGLGYILLAVSIFIALHLLLEQLRKRLVNGN